MKNLTIQNLKYTSQNWDKRTKDVLLNLGGSGNMFGGKAKYVHITIHGENSIYETGSISILGVALFDYNIARGENGDTENRMRYFKGQQNFDKIREISASNGVDFSVIVKGSCGGAEEAMNVILSTQKDFFQE